MSIDTKALRELLQHATEGEWRPQVAGALDDHVNVENMDGETLLTVEGDAWERWDDAFNEAKANAHLVAAMKNALPELLDAYDRLAALEAELASLRTDRDGAAEACRMLQEDKARLEQDNARLREALQGWWEAHRPVGWTEDQHRSCPHVNLATEAGKALATALLRDQEGGRTDRQRTHSHDCWSWGPAHYECAIRQIRRDETLLRQTLEALEILHDELLQMKEHVESMGIRKGYATIIALRERLVKGKQS